MYQVSDRCTGGKERLDCLLESPTVYYLKQLSTAISCHRAYQRSKEQEGDQLKLAVLERSGLHGALPEATFRLRFTSELDGSPLPSIVPVILYASFAKME
jgi:hypothetical protein